MATNERQRLEAIAAAYDKAGESARVEECDGDPQIRVMTPRRSYLVWTPDPAGRQLEIQYDDFARCVGIHRAADTVPAETLARWVETTIDEHETVEDEAGGAAPVDDRPSVLCDACGGTGNNDECEACWGTGLDSVAADRAPLFPMDYRDSHLVLPRGGPN